MGMLPRPTREAVFSAIFVKLQKATGFTSYSRRMIDYSVIPPGIMPILILWELHEMTEYQHQGLGADYWHASIVIVFQNLSRPQENDPTTAVPGATILNPLIDSVRASLAPDDLNRNN